MALSNETRAVLLLLQEQCEEDAFKVHQAILQGLIEAQRRIGDDPKLSFDTLRDILDRTNMVAFAQGHRRINELLEQPETKSEPVVKTTDRFADLELTSDD